MRGLACVVLMMLVVSPGVAAAMECAAPLFESDAEGNVIRGSRLALREAAMRGDPLRVGWRITWGPGPREFVQHWADAAFVTVFEDDVFAQVPMIHRQSPVGGKSHIVLPGALEHWIASLGSNGVMVHKYSTATKASERRVAQLWCLSGEAAQRCLTAAWRATYRHGPDGKPLAGSKRALVDAIRRGEPIRLTWQIAGPPGSPPAPEQSAAPVLVSITGDKVTAQIAEHVVDPAPAALGRALVTTDGTFERLVTAALRRSPRQASVAWFAYTLDTPCQPPVPAGSKPT